MSPLSATRPLVTFPVDQWDPLHSPTDPAIHWTRANVGEAMPGVQTPLSWTLWRAVIERGSREALWAIGALSQSERAVPARLQDQAVRAFCGRVALRVDFLTTLGDRMPGTTGEETALAVLGRIPAGLELHPTRRRYPAVAWRLPHAFATTPARARRFARETDAWYSTQIQAVPSRDAAGAAKLFEEASLRFREAVSLQILTLFAAVQPLYQALEKLVARASVGEVATLSGAGGPEGAVVVDIWRAAQGEITVEDLAAAHGFHGPLEGELCSRVWREDDSPLRALVERYADRDDPRRTRDTVDLGRMQRSVAAGFPVAARPVVRGVLALAAQTIPMRGVVKRSFLQCFDVLRACARRYGVLMAEGGLIDAADDVFFLTAEEVIGGARPPDIRELIARRRARHAEYACLDLATSWTGVPVPLAPEQTTTAAAVTGTGVSPGVVEGIAFVVTDPSFVEVEPDRILIAPTTDPSWSAIMFVSAGLVVDIGGAMSHAAVVAREMGIPCVVGTATGTRMIRTGDRIRLDGSSGLVEVLHRSS